MTLIDRIQGGMAVVRALSSPKAFRIALAIWIVYAAIIAILVAAQPNKRTVTPEYRKASIEWWAGNPIYKGRMHGYLYLPHCAILYTPYTWLPLRVGEVAWRFTAIGLFGWCIWRLCSVFGAERRKWWFLVATVGALPASLSCARNGQANLPMAALLAFAAVDLGRGAWNRSALSLILSFALKPLGVVPCLLAGACYSRKMVFRLVLALVFLGLISFVHFRPEYVIEQYKMMVETLRVAGQPNQRLFCDVQGLLITFGIMPAAKWMLAIRALAAVGALWTAILALRRYDAARGAFVCMMLSALYLVLFNPRTETNSYVLLAPFLGVLIADCARHPHLLSRFLWLSGFAVILTCENWGALHKWTNLWLKAAASLVISWYLVRDIYLARDPLGLRKPDSD